MLAQTLAELFSMDEETWKGHANPWCFWTRLSVIPFLFLAIWSRIWLDWWSLLLAVMALFWVWLNTRLFPPPDSTDNWASKSVFGERVWINRNEIFIPPHHRYFPHILTSISTIGLVISAWGLATLNLYFTGVGTLLIYVGKLWFLDRMVWLYQDMKDVNPEYRSWLY
jgi:hypothetical protein